jgi:hypothetical protein
MRYRIMFSNELTTAMFDDGSARRRAAGDGARRDHSREPVHQRPDDSLPHRRHDTSARFALAIAYPTATEEYLGTIVNRRTSPANCPSSTCSSRRDNWRALIRGRRGVVLYDGEFYDNIYELRGNTSAWAKKAHRLEFNRATNCAMPAPAAHAQIIPAR